MKAAEGILPRVVNVYKGIWRSELRFVRLVVKDVSPVVTRLHSAMYAMLPPTEPITFPTVNAKTDSMIN